MAFETGRRLCVLLLAGEGRFAIEATSVVEISPPGEDGGRIRGLLELKDLSVVLGGPEEVRPGIGLVLDVSPTLAIRAKGVIGVIDVARDPFFHLPPGLGSALAHFVRGAVLHQGQLFLELMVEALPHKPAVPGAALARPVYLLDHPPDRALLFESRGGCFAVPLSLVSQVVRATDALCPIPGGEGPVAGLFPYAQALWPIYSAGGLLGGKAVVENLLILTELAGQNVGLSAERVIGVGEKFVPGPDRGEYIPAGSEKAALFLDLQRMFS